MIRDCAANSGRVNIIDLAEPIGGCVLWGADWSRQSQPDVGFGVGIAWDCLVGERQTILREVEADFPLGRTRRLISNTKYPTPAREESLQRELKGVMIGNRHTIVQRGTDVNLGSSNERH